MEPGSAVVRQVWKAIGTIGGSGSWPTGSGALTWSGGTGTYVADNGNILEFFRVTGTIPTTNMDITGGTRTFHIDSFPPENLSATAPVCNYPAYFGTTGGTQGAIQANDTFYVSASEPRGIVAGSPAPGTDSFNLTIAWSGGTPLVNVEAVINRDRTDTYGWDLVEQGSRMPFAILKETIRAIDAQVAAGGGGGGTPPGAFNSFGAFGTNWANVGGAYATAQYAYASGSGEVQLRGFVYKTTGTSTNGETIVSALPSSPINMRPASTLVFNFEGERFAIRSNGVITWEGTTGSTPGPISFDGITFRSG